MPEVWYAARKRRAFRAAAQAVGAFLIGAPLAKVSIEDGAIIAEVTLRSATPRSDRYALAHAFVCLMGVGAVNRYSFGSPVDNRILLDPHGDDTISAGDLNQAAMAWLRLERPVFAVMVVVLQYVSELLAQPDIWEGIERLADRLLEGQLTGIQVALLCTEFSQDH